MMNSTMGAPLTPEEEATILGAWTMLGRVARNLTVLPGPTSRGEDIVQMLNQATELVIRVSELRSAISNAWHYANKRAFPDPEPVGVVRRPRTAAISKSQALAQLGLTQADFDELLDQMRGADGNRG